MEKEQLLYVSLDDSGKLNKKEKYLVYAGLFFTNKKELERFKAVYKSIRNNIAKKDIYQNIDELKGHTLESKDRLRLLRYIYKFNTAGLIVDNSQITKKDILISKNAKGRYRDYVIKLLIKDIIIHLIKEGKLNPHKKLTLIINMDQESSKTNGKYKLDEGIYEELIKGIINYNYGFTSIPILFNELTIKIYSQNSKDSIIIQASDLIANNIWRNMIKTGEINSGINVLKKFP
ncbi:MAG: DUF3800 domain-containing protein [Bacilli bacterium]